MTKANIRKLLTKPKFRAWLEGHGPLEFVGQNYSSCGCPLARYSGQPIGKDDTGYLWVRTNRQISKWGQRFAWKVDSGDSCGITASRALKILDGIK